MIHNNWKESQINVIQDFAKNNPDFIKEAGGMTEYERIADKILYSIKGNHIFLVNNEWKEVVRLKVIELHKKLTVQ